jgi:hypothetical protein
MKKMTFSIRAKMKEMKEISGILEARAERICSFIDPGSKNFGHNILSKPKHKWFLTNIRSENVWTTEHCVFGTPCSGMFKSSHIKVTNFGLDLGKLDFVSERGSFLSLLCLMPVEV